MILLLFSLLQNVVGQGINLALSDLTLTATGWSATASDGTTQSYNTISTQCNNQNLFILNRNFQKYSKIYTITDYEFYQLFIELDIYFYQFTQTTISIQVNSQVIYEQTFTSQKLKLNNICGTGQDSQYTIYQGFYTKQQTLQLQIEYIQNVVDSNSYVGINNFNIYSNGIPLIGGCPMNAPFNLNGVCQSSCPSTQYYLGGPDLNQCLGPINGNSLIKQILTTDDWVYWLTGSYLTNNNLYPNIMNNQIFNSQYASDSYFISNYFSRTQNCKLQIQFIFYIFGEWDDQSIVTLVIGSGGQHPLHIAKYYGVYQSSTLSGIYFTNVTTSTGQSIVARKTQIIFQVNYYDSSIYFTFKQSIIGTGSFGFSDITFYDASTTTYLTTIFDLTCPVGFYQYRGMCKSSCAAYQVISNTNYNCTDYSNTESQIFNPNQAIDLFGYYLIKQFYSNNFRYTDIANTFTILPPQLNNFYNGQYFSYVQGKKILGGYNSWGYGAYGKTYSNLQPHVQLRIYFNLYLIDDFQSGDDFQMYIDGSLISQINQSKSQQLQGLNSLDLKIGFNHTQPHYQSKLQIIFLCNIAQKDSSKASCGISDLFVLLDSDLSVLCPMSNMPFSYLTSDCEYETSNYLCYTYQCTVCSNSTCSQCSSLLGYVITQSNDCDCAVGFYSDWPVQNCQKCHYSCATCYSGGSTNCLTCDSSRTLLVINDPYSQTCPCNSNLYDVEPQISCQPITSCHYSCLTCFGIQYYQCLSCPSNSLRTLTTTQQCQCNSGSLDLGFTQCVQPSCDSTCLTCSDVGNQSCLSCDGSSNRQLVSGSCLCTTGFNDYLNPGNACIQNYSPCHYSCLTCYGSLQTNCLSCSSVNQRALQSNQCPCNNGYIDINVYACVVNYSPCQYSCLTCFAGDQNSCITCQSQRTLNIIYGGTLQTCTCNHGLYDNGQTCLACHSTCKTCNIAGQSNCLSCDSSQNRQFQASSCPCLTNYNDYLNSGNACVQNYSPCHYSCLTCYGSLQTNCLTCDSILNRLFQQSDNSCQCNQNYFDNGVASCQNQISCHSNCLTCSGPSNSECNTCSSNRTLTGSNCPCSSGFNEIANPGTCVSNYSPCHQSCVSCYGGLATNCLTCSAVGNRVFDLVTSTCPCITNYYDQNGTLGDCQFTCHYSCNNCFGLNQNQCLDCQQNQLRTYNSATNTCDCPLGYDGSQALCTLNCHDTCLTCFGPLSTNCNTCDIDRYYIDSQCQCLAGTNDFINPPICVDDLTICYSPYILVCFGNLVNQAISCDLSQKRIIQNNVCVCQVGYFEDSAINFGCSLCHYSCQTCVSTSQNCQSCSIQNNRYLISQTCPCLQNYNEVNQALCISCLNNDCLTCDILQQCLTCKQDVKHVENGICVCNDGYYQADNNCFQCDSGCLTCFGPLNTQCQSCHIDKLKQLIDSHCECITGYQENDQKHCVDCSSLLGKSIVKCQYADPLDGVWTYGEQCDDANTNSKDGCANFSIQIGYTCINTFNQQSICYKCQDNCVKCDIIKQELICITCQDSYYNNQKQCIKCMDLQCKYCKSPAQCEVCFNNIAPIKGKCIQCDQGYYQVGLQCKTKCGDGFRAFDEQCDDGNNYSGDGCNANCQLEDNYVCNTIQNLSNCVITSPPILQIYSITINKQDMRRFTIQSSQNVYYSNISLQILSDQTQFIKLQYQIVVQQDQNIIGPLQIDANLTFSQTFSNLDLTFQLNGQIENEYQQEIEIRQLQINVKNIQILSQQQKEISSQVNQASQGTVSALAVTSISQLILLGSIQQFMQLLNIIQQLYYIQYVNIQFPPNFADFFNILSRFNIQSVQFVSLSSFSSFFQLDLITYIKPSLKFQQFGINAYFLANIQQFLIQCLTGILLYKSFKLMIFLLYLIKVQFSKNTWFNKHLYSKIHKLQHRLIKSCSYLKKNGFIQLMLTSCYDVQFAIQLQLSIDNEDLNQTLNKLSAFGFLLFYCYIIIKLNQFQDEELNQSVIWQNKLNQIKMVQALIFMFTIVNLQDYPEFQVGLISLSSFIILVYTQQLNPLKDFFNNFKLIIQELCMFLTSVSFILYIYSPIEINLINLGWFQVGLYCIMIIGNIIIEAYSNAIRIYKFYQKPKQQPIQMTKRVRVISTI